MCALHETLPDVLCFGLEYFLVVVLILDKVNDFSVRDVVALYCNLQFVSFVVPELELYTVSSRAPILYRCFSPWTEFSGNIPNVFNS